VLIRPVCFLNRQREREGEKFWWLQKKRLTKRARRKTYYFVVSHRYKYTHKSQVDKSTMKRDLINDK
jgi:hypothetical protein